MTPTETMATSTTAGAWGVPRDHEAGPSLGDPIDRELRDGGRSPALRRRPVEGDEDQHESDDPGTLHDGTYIAPRDSFVTGTPR